MMLEIHIEESDTWIKFFPVNVNTNEIYESKLKDLPDEVMGKYMGGIVGYTPVWYYTTVKKARLREVVPEYKK